MERTAFARIWILPPLLMVLGAAALSADIPVSEWFREPNNGVEKISKDLNKLIHFSEAFAEGHAVAMILLVLLVVDVTNRWKIARLAAMSLGAGVLANVIKLFIVRARPKHFFKEMPPGDIWTTFRYETWELNLGSSSWQGCPSSHAATGVGLAIGLTWLHPRGKWLFAFLAILACAQRIGSSYHFLSDVCWGAAVGSGVGWFCLRSKWGQKWFGWIESRPSAGKQVAAKGKNLVEPLGEIR